MKNTLKWILAIPTILGILSAYSYGSWFLVHKGYVNSDSDCIKTMLLETQFMIIKLHPPEEREALFDEMKTNIQKMYGNKE